MELDVRIAVKSTNKAVFPLEIKYFMLRVCISEQQKLHSFDHYRFYCRNIFLFAILLFHLSKAVLSSTRKEQ